MTEALKRKLISFRQELHQYPELSGWEKDTSKKIQAYFQSLNATKIVSKIGGEGIAVIFEGMVEGPTTLLRCELDALPIAEENNISYKSKYPGKSHACGHDGHMAILCGVGEVLSITPPKKGMVILLFQPAEETGQGAAKVLKSLTFTPLLPDYAFALHNIPGYKKNQIILKKDTFTAASKGMEIHLKGRTSHAAFPEDGNSPADAMSKIILELQKLSGTMGEFSLVTVVNAVLGEIAFGTTPGEAVIRATLRSFEDHLLDNLTDKSESLVDQIAKEYGISVTIEYRECFNSTENHPEAYEFVNSAASQLHLEINHVSTPFRWSEDFGQFSKATKTTLFGIGAGYDQPQLHEGVFDFPDDIIPTGVEIFTNIIRQIND